VVLLSPLLRSPLLFLSILLLSAQLLLSSLQLPPLLLSPLLLLGLALRVDLGIPIDCPTRHTLPMDGTVRILPRSRGHFLHWQRGIR
jgi:hypothetical protein